MDVVEAILIILALKIPIVGLLFWVYTLMKEPAEDPEPEKVRSKMPPRLPEPGDRAVRADAARTAVAAPRRVARATAPPTRHRARALLHAETAPAPVSRSTSAAARRRAAGAGALTCLASSRCW